MGLIYYFEERDAERAESRAQRLPAIPARPEAPAPTAVLPGESRGCFVAFLHFLHSIGKKEAAQEPLLPR